MENNKAKIYPEHEPIPFWFYNDKYDEAEIIRQLDCMKENGITAFYLHVRDGKTVEEAYGTDMFFEQIKFIVEQAVERDIKVWLYDEDSYPSGNCGGKIVFNHPELLSYTLKVEKVDVKDGVARKELGLVKGLYGYAVNKKDGKESVKVVKNCFGPTRKYWYRVLDNTAYYYDMGDIKYPHLRGETNYAKMTFEMVAKDDEDVYVAYLVPAWTDERFGFQVDALNERTAQLFIEYVHENYKKYVGKYFGKEIPGIFFDEPWTGGWYIPYTDQLNGYFYKKYGYRLEDNLYKFCENYKGNYQEFQRQYLSACSDLFSKNFILPIKKWCEKNNLKFTGHFVAEENIIHNPKSGQNIFENIKQMDIPGFDIICTNLGDLEHPALVVGANIVSSCARQFDKKTVLAECMALAPFNLNYYGEKRIADWLIVNGINMFVPHALYYGFSAFQHAEAGKSFFFQDAYFDDYIKFTHYAGRVCKIVKEYERNNKILLVLPGESIASYSFHYTHTDKDSPLYKIDQIVKAFACEAMSKQVGFDTTSSLQIKDIKVKNKKVNVGSCVYDKVFIVDGDVENGIYKTLLKKGVDCILLDGKTLVELEKDPFIEGDYSNVLLYKKTNKKGILKFAFNNSNEYLKFNVRVGENAYVYDAELDKNLKLNVQNGLAKVCIQPYDSLIVIDGEKVKIDGEYTIIDKVEDRHEYLTSPEVYYKPKQAKEYVTDFTISVEKDGKITQYKDQKYRRLRDVLGTRHDVYRCKYMVPYYDQAKLVESPYPVKAIYSTNVKIKDGGYLLFDGGTISGDYKLYWNGEEVCPQELVKKRVYDTSNFAYYPKKTQKQNLLEIVFEQADEFSGINGEIYVCDKE